MLSNYIPDKSYAIVAGYANGELIGALGGVLYHQGQIEIVFPKINPFYIGQEITFHLDNRTGLEELDSSMKVYRVSVKALVLTAVQNRIYVEPVEYELKYSNRILEKYCKPEYSFPVDNRPVVRLAESTLEGAIEFNEKEKDNKLGVLISRSLNRPHTTVMAFLSSVRDDIFIISHSDSYKSHNIHRDERCIFAIDHRSSFIFERAIEWNYTLIKGILRRVSRTHPLFETIQGEFVRKNPFEYAFFTDEKVELYQIEPVELLCPEKLCRV
jgi:hypothetical protein